MDRRLLWTWLLPTVLFALMLTTSATAATIEIREQVTLTPRSMIQLRDLAIVADADAERQRQLEELAMTPAPAAGRTVRISYEDIRARLQACGISLLDVEFRGRQGIDVRMADPVKLNPEIARVSRPAPTIVPTAASQLTRTTPARWEQAKADDLALSALRRVFRTAAVEARGWRFQCRVAAEAVAQLSSLSADQLQYLESQLTQSSSQTLHLTWTDRDAQPQTAMVTLTMEESPMGLALRQPLPMGALLRPEDLTWEPVPEKSTAINRLAEVLGKQLTRNVREGQLLQATDLESVPLVRSNEIVTVIVRRHGITVRRPFKSLSTGALHDTVQLCALDDPRVRLQAVVTGFHEATVAGEPLELQQVYRDAAGTTPLGPAIPSHAAGGPR